MPVFEQKNGDVYAGSNLMYKTPEATIQTAEDIISHDYGILLLMINQV